MPSSQGSRDGVGTLPGQAVGTLQIFPQTLCAFVHDSGKLIFETPKPRRKICGKSAQTSVENLRIAHQKSAHKNLRKKSVHKICAKSAHKSAHQHQRTNVPRTGVKIPSLWKMKARKNTKNICAKFVQNPQPQLGFLCLAVTAIPRNSTWTRL